MFETMTLFTLVLAPVGAYLAGVMVFALFNILHKNHFMPLTAPSSIRNGH